MNNTKCILAKNYRCLGQIKCFIMEQHNACNLRFIDNDYNKGWLWAWTMEFLSQTQIDTYLLLVATCGRTDLIIIPHLTAITVYEPI